METAETEEPKELPLAQSAMLSPKLAMLFDGSCPLCLREVKFLRSLSRAPLVNFVDITHQKFSAAEYGSPRQEKLLDELHVFNLEQRTMHTRVPAFRELYKTLFGVDVLRFTATWPFTTLSDRAYTFIAREKHRVAWMLR